MPIYEYICLSCSENFSLLRGVNAGGEVECPKCGAKGARKVISSFCCSSGSGGGFSPSSSSGGFGGG